MKHKRWLGNKTRFQKFVFGAQFSKTDHSETEINPKYIKYRYNSYNWNHNILKPERNLDIVWPNMSIFKGTEASKT